MPQAADQLVVRQHERLTCRLAATLRVADEHVRQVALAASSGDGAGTLSLHVVDCSRGGLGLDSPIFLPRACRVRIKLAPDGASPGGTGFQGVEFTAKIQRITMTSRTPSYYLGLAFIPEGDEHQQKVERLISYVRSAARKPAPAAPVGAAPSEPQIRRAG